MELWIRSADKEILLKVNELEIEENMIIAFDNSKYQCLGTYKTKERALEVLDEIQDILKPTIITTSYECECKNNPTNKMKFDLEMVPQKTEIQELSTYVYKMPKE